MAQSLCKYMALLLYAQLVAVHCFNVTQFARNIEKLKQPASNLSTPHIIITVTEVKPHCVQMQCKFVCFNGKAVDIPEDIVRAMNETDIQCPTIEELRLYNYQFVNNTIQKGFLGEFLQRVENFYIASSNVSDYEAGAFGGGIFEELYFENLQFAELRKDFFEGVSVHFQALTVIQKNSPLAMVAQDFTDYVKLQLKYLTLQVGMTALENITASRNLLNSLGYADFSYNDLGSSLTKNSFRRLSVIEHLDLSYANITYIPEYIFGDLVATLEYLNLNGNRLKTIYRTIFGLRVLQSDMKIYADDNPWLCDCELQHEMEVLFAYHSSSMFCAEPAEFHNWSVFDDRICNGFYDVLATTTQAASQSPPGIIATTTSTTPTTTSSTTSSTTPSTTSTTTPSTTPTTTPTTTSSTTSSTTPPTNTSPDSLRPFIPTLRPPTVGTTEEIKSLPDSAEEKDDPAVTQPGILTTHDDFEDGDEEGFMSLQCLNPLTRMDSNSQKLKSPSLKFDLLSLPSLTVSVRLGPDSLNDSYGLMWFSKVSKQFHKMETNYNEYGLGCYGQITYSTTVTDLLPDVAYTFCLVLQNERTLSPFSCKSVHVSSNLQVFYSAWLTRDMQATGISVIVLSVVMFTFLGISVVFLVLKRKPTLIKGSNRVGLTKGNKDEIVVFPRKETKRSIQKREEMYASRSSQKQIIRYDSMDSIDSNQSYMNTNLYEVIPAYLKFNDPQDSTPNSLATPTTPGDDSQPASYLPPLQSDCNPDNVVSYAEIPYRSKRISSDPLPEIPATETITFMINDKHNADEKEEDNVSVYYARMFDSEV